MRKQDIAIFDLDGCLFDDSHRLPLINLDLVGDARFDAYHGAMSADGVLEEGQRIINLAVEQNLRVVFLTARPLKFSVSTLNQIRQHFGELLGGRYPIYMRADGDERSSVEYKRETILRILSTAKSEGREVVVAFDDRPDVVAMYREEGVPSWILDKEGTHCPGSLRDSRFCMEQRGLIPPRPAAPVADGPTQPQLETPPNRERDAGDVLKEALATYYDRRSVYGVAHVKFGNVMAALFPEGITLKTTEDHQLFHMVGHIAGKLTRFAGSGLKDHDSVLDISTYAALAHTLVDAANIDTGSKPE